ncbi:MAG: ABC transporter permease [Limnochordia bacterium]|nr:ABC transporter permease [Limnochordia bacterium]MDD4516968.1 ABC transporter permease [Limnochordia bacterium]
MQLKNQLWWAWRQSRRRVFESLLIVLAIGLGVGVIIAVFSMFSLIALQEQSMWEMGYFRTFQVSQQREIRDYEAPLSPVVPVEYEEPVNIELEDLTQLKQLLPEGYLAFMETRTALPCPLLPESEEALPEEMRFRGPENSIEILEMTVDVPAFYGYELIAGQWFLEEDVEARNNVAVIGDKLARRVFGEQDPVGQLLPLLRYDDKEMSFTIIGVVKGHEEDYGEDHWRYWEDPGQWLMVPLESIHPEGVSFGRDWFTVGVQPGIDIGQAYYNIRRAAQLYFGDQMVVEGAYLSWEEGKKHTRFIARVIGLFASMGLLIAVINILNLLLARVLRRTRQIGISKALGANAASIFTQFLLEAMVLGVFGAVAGIGLSHGMVLLLQRLVGNELVVGTGAMGIGIAIAFATSLLFGAYPAYQAAKTDPVDALRTE